ncbi:hypothetical protein DPMN_166418 [Dreissena polymorpha]|uniref:Uncharacterized protein n=1 Tax=Dreissena polymorpha TaxID=45954 RepID=A0A9D4F2H8_DREPO|nr:hypothetical protein DPMN_166418 [Dreissena polymorpha]
MRLQTKVIAIKERLKVDLNKLASTQRKLNSVPDNRSSAKAVGLVGMIFLVLILLFFAIFVFDIGNIIRDLKTLRDNLRQGCGCAKTSSPQARFDPSSSV